MEKKWIAVLGSPRRNKNTEKIMDYYIEELEICGGKVEKIVLSEIELNICNGCEWCIQNNDCRYNDDISIIIDKVKNAQGIILGSPSYNYNVTSYMKVFLDRPFSLFTFGKGSWSSELDSRGIKAIIIGVCAGSDKPSMGFTIDAMKRVMINSEETCIGFIIVTDKGAFDMYPYFHLIIVHKDCRGKGCGTFLMKYYED